jgi:hypothetical protein
VAVLAGFGTLVVMEAITVAVYTAPSSPRDIAVITALAVAADLTGWALIVLWRRMTRARRQYRNSG